MYGCDLRCISHDRWSWARVLGKFFNGDKFKTWVRMFVEGWQSCVAIGLRIGLLEQKVGVLKIIGLLSKFSELW